MALAIRGRQFAIAFPTNGGVHCVAAQVPIAGFAAFRADIEGTFFRTLAMAPALAPHVRPDRRAERWYGTADLPNFFRKPYGSGWALVGDAGYHKDPLTAQGISDAFRDAELLAEALDAGFSGRLAFDDAMAGYERQRNEAAQPLYANAIARAAFTPFPDEVYQARAAARAAATSATPA